ncbi:hypothetical protein [Cupriavidus sp. IDO]|uniref:hypothetical protein n=1 Tax=Cupriavidus sp. IDO TaxID=1539142 RepID=UPI000579731D|nr:hypothetical protein [Cupriavidus sp. IDO]KWR87814.1 hypothetical protein RM96_22725 [Cupriavidus sp. IDO]
MAKSLMRQVREAMVDAAPCEPIVSARDREAAVLLLQEAIASRDALKTVIRLAAAVELRASISKELWTRCGETADKYGDAAVRRLFRSARGRSFAVGQNIMRSRVWQGAEMPLAEVSGECPLLRHRGSNEARN